MKNLINYFRGRASRAELKQRIAGASITGLRQAWQWQDVVGMTLPELKQMIESVRRGEWNTRYPDFAEKMEESDGHYRAVLQQRRLAVTGVTRRVEAAGEDAAAMRHAELVEQVIAQADFDDLLANLLDGLAKGFAATEIVWKADGEMLLPMEYHRVDPRWIFWGRDGETPYLIDDSSGGGFPGGGAEVLGAPLSWGKFIVHAPATKSGLPARGGLAIPCATLFLLKNFAIRDWWAFADIFGLPLRVGKFGPNATDEDKRTLEGAMAELAANFGVIIPESMSIEFMTASSGNSGSAGSGDNLFVGMSRWVDTQMSKAIVGQTMTADDGSSLSQARVHQEVRQDLVKDDARQLAATLNRQLVRFVVDLNFGRQKKYPRIVIREEDPVDVEMWSKSIEQLARAGVPISQAWVRARLGIPDPDGTEPVIGGKSAAPDDDGKNPNSARALNAGGGDDHSGDWVELTADLSEPMRAVLNESGVRDPEDFLRRALASGTPTAIADDLAMRSFKRRVDGADSEGA